MAKIHELLGLDESGMAVKAQNPPAQAAGNGQNGANSSPGSSSSQKNDGARNNTKKAHIPGPFDGTNGVASPARVKADIAKTQADTFAPNQGAYTQTLDSADGIKDLPRYDGHSESVSIARNPQKDAQKKHLTYAEMVDKLYPEQAEARRKADDERAAKKRRREAVISALGDGLTTIANLGSVIGGANPVSHETLSERSQARWDKIKADKDARRDAYRAARLRAQQADQEREDALAAVERTAKQRAEDNAREDAYRLLQLKNQRDIAGLRTDAQRDIAEGNWAARKYATDKSYAGRVYAANHKSSGGGQKYGYKWIEQYNPLTGKNEMVYVTGNQASKYYQDMEGQDNVTHTREDDGFGGTKEKEVKTRNGNKSANAQHTKDNHKQVSKSGNGQGGKGGKTIPGTRQARKQQVGPA